MKKLGFALCILLLATLTYAQSSTLAGTVLDKAGKPIPGAAVTVKNEASGSVSKATTGEDGHFSVSGLTAGVYTVEVSADKFATTTPAGRA
jgi:hypothetical protein